MFNLKDSLMPKVSIVVPAHNVEPWLARCIDSLLCQSLHDIEIILVENGSTDSTLDICSAYEKKDSRIRLLSFERADVSAARNAGIKIAKAPYIGFVDADDWVEPDMFELLYSSAISKGDRWGAVCLYDHKYDDVQMADAQIVDFSPYTEMNGPAFCQKLMMRNAPFGVWAYIWPRDVFDIKLFPEGRFFEDYASIHIWIHALEGVSWIPRPLYHYFQRSGSTMDRVPHDLQLAKDYAVADIERLEWLLRHKDVSTDDTAVPPYVAYVAMEKFNYMMRLCRSIWPKKELNQCRRRLIQNLKNVDCQHINSKTRLHIFLLRYCWPLSYWTVMLRSLSNRKQ